jgi:leucyl aminopeptidase
MDITDYPELGKNTPVYKYFIPSQPTHQDVVIPLLQRLSISNVWNTITELSSYTTRYYTSATGVSSANALLGKYRGYAGSNANVEVNPFPHTWAQPSIIARINGKGPSADEIVIVGGHIDSTSSGTRAPGADDDASGSATVLEVFRVIVESNFEPERTLEFHGYAAEEVGLRGSQAIATAYANEGKNVVAMLQMDMTAFVRSGTNPTIGVVTDFTNAPLSAFVRALASEYTASSWSNTACGYGCSDHASWTRAGYPAAFAFESLFSNSNPTIHTVNDLISNLSQAQARHFLELALSFSVELSFAE